MLTSHVVRMLPVLVAVVGFAAASSAQTTALSPHAFMSVVIGSLADAQIVLEQQDEANRPAATDTLNGAAVLTKARGGRSRLLRAGTGLGRFQESESELVRKGAEALALVYGELAALQEKRIASLEAAEDASGFLAQQNYLLRLLVESVGASSYALVDYHRPRPVANHRYLLITTAQRDELLRQLEQHFPHAAQQGVSRTQRAPEVSAAYLWTWLNRKEWVPSDPH